MPDLTLAADLDTLLSAANFAAARTSLSLTTLSTTTPGTGVATALAVNVGSSGAFVVQNGALGTPSSATLTSATGLPISTGVSGLGTGVATALTVNVGSAGAPVVLNGAGGTPSAIVLTNGTGLPLSTLTGAGTGVLTALAVNTGSAGAFAVMGAVGTFTNLTHTGPEIATSVSHGAVTANSTITTAARTTIRVTAAGAVTGIRLEAGTVDGQKCTVVHESAANNTLTMAAASTSNVADGVGTVIAGLTAQSFVWNSSTARWYHEK